jgi:AcrR family transcriptional regulator
MTAQPSPAPLDRRTRRTRTALRAAFVSLVLERGFDHVTIEDITDRADVARATFYAHYPDKGTLFAAIIDEMTKDLAVRLTRLAPVESSTIQGAAVLELYKHADDNRDLYRLMLSGAADGQARRAYTQPLVQRSIENFTARISAFKVEPPMPPELTAQAFVGMHLALLEWWLAQSPGYTAAQMTSFEMQIFMNGVSWAQGLAPGTLTLDESLLASP